MTPYRFDNKEKKQKVSRTKIVAGVFSVVVAVLVIIFVLAPLIQRLSRGPVWLTKNASSVGTDIVNAATPKRVLLAKIQTLETQIQSDQAQLLAYSDTQSENTALRTELSYIAHPVDVMAAQVLEKPSNSLYDSMIIDRGTNDGVHVGQVVTVQGTIGLGTIVTVNATTSTVKLFSSPAFDGDLVIKSANITVPAIGKGSGNFEIHIPHDINVASGDLLAFPDSPDMIVGVVKSITFDPRDPFQTVLARTPVNVQQLQFVEIVK